MSSFAPPAFPSLRLAGPSRIRTVAGLIAALTVAGPLARPVAAQPQITVSPSTLTETLGAGAEAVQTLSVTNTGSAPLSFRAARGPASAAVGGPDASGYTWTDSDRPGGPVYHWTDIRETGTELDVLVYEDVDLPFAFPFYGQTFTSVRVVGDGLLVFGEGYVGGTYNNRPIPWWDTPDRFLAPFWDDLNVRGPGSSVYTGTDARGRFVVQFQDVVPGSGASGRYTFQVVLDPSGTVLYQYGPMTGPTTSATVGTESAGSTTGLEIAYDEPYVRDGLAVRIARGDPWVSVSADARTLAPGASVDLPVTFSSHDLAAGTRSSTLVLTSADGATQFRSVPTTLTILSEPDATVSATALDFGAVYVGVAREDTVFVTNTGSAPLQIVSVGTGASPFSASLGGSASLAPGERRAVRVAYAPTAAETSSGTLTLVTNDPDEPALTVALTGEGTLAPDVSVTPSALSVALAVGETLTTTVTLANSGASDLDFSLRFRPPNGGALDSLYYDFGTPTAGTTGWTPWMPFAVSNRFTADGRFHLSAIDAFLKIERDPTVRVEVYGAATFGDPTSGPLLWSRDVAIPHDVAAMYRVPLDTTLSFEDGEDFYVVIWTQEEFAPFGTHASNGGRSYRRTYHGPQWHHETGSTTYVVRALQTLGAALSVEPAAGTIAPGSSQEVALTVDGSVLPGGQHLSALVVTSNDPDTPALVVPLTLDVSGAAAIATADSLQFDEVYLGQARTQALRIRNLGTAPLTVSNVTSPDPAFTVTPAAPFTVGVGESDTLHVTFAPVTAGPHDGVLTITSDAAGTPTLAVALSGEGVEFPSITVAPDSVAVALLAGESATATFTLSNGGPGPLTYAIEGFTGHAPAAEPDSLGYTWTDSRRPGGPVFDWVDISATGTALSLGDDTYQDVALPFVFPFYGDDKMVVRVSSNGYLTFGGQRGDIWDNKPIPHNWTPNDLVAVLWDAVDPSAGGTVYTGTDAQGRFVVQYDNVTLHSQPTWRATFQAILDPGGNLLFQYLDVDGPWGGTIGIENADATVGLQVSYDAFPSFLTDSLAVRIDAPTPWLTMAEPATGTVAAGQSAEVTLTLDADSLEQGEYAATLRIASNDPDQPLTLVPVALEVSGTLRLPLNAGWNLVSWNVQPENNAVETVLASILDRLDAVETYEAGERRTFVPGRTDNTIAALMPTYGYWIKLSEAATLEIDGAPVDRQLALPLVAGVNAVSYLPWRVSGTGYALESVMDVTQTAASFQGTGVTYAPGVPAEFQVLDRMRPKAGYVIRTTAPGTLVYPASPGGHTVGDARPTLDGRLLSEQQAGVTPTMGWLDVWGADVRLADGTPLAVGTRVVAVDAQGRAVGAFDVVAEGRLGLMTIYADDPYTSEKDGAVPGESITLRAGDTVLTHLDWTMAGDVIDLTGLIVSNEDGRGAVPTEFALAPNHPNPFHTTTTIRFALPEAAPVRLTVYDALGRLVATLVDGERAPGHHEAVWSADGVANGFYIYRIEAGPHRQSRQMLLVK